jgi:hypothetical protein
MKRLRDTALAILIAAAALSSAAATGAVGTKQRVAIQRTAGSDAVALIPLTSGALGRDSGTFTSCCWSRRFVMRDGQKIEINDPLITFTWKRGSLEARSRIEWIGVGNGYAVGTHRWKVVRGTGDYAGLAGGGRGAVIELPNGAFKYRLEGFLSTR